ncbi:PAAR-like protein [Zobellia sp. 1_MG-2023]|uniref:PAAR-like protein n=1 Tax=Zobellia sp. 1_MG-2023 TaxID=3062626 RepID=UPI0026E3B4F3|nr:PAAR-like protein [Zobellia sp. 1_MG-2023]MDO6819029.1 PAAR-like protein [Zobellia sp. 1_MG-2023]
MANKKYVPQGTYLACDKGTVPVEFKITNNNNTFLFDEPVANTGDMVPMVNVQPMGVCTVTSSACVPAPIMWDGFEDGIFVGLFNPLLEDSVLPCGVGGKIEIFYSLEEATAACAEEESSFWETLGKVVLVVAAVALIVVTGGMAIAAIGAVAAASGALATGIAVTVAALEVAGCLLTVKALYDYSQDGDEEALFKEVALGFLFLGAGKVLEKGFRMWKAGKAGDELVEVFGEGLEPMLKGKVVSLPNIQKSIFNYVKRSADEVADLRKAFNSKARKEFLEDLGKNEDLLRNKGFSDIDIAKIKNGKVPKDYQVHHKYPLDDGGTNEIDNLVLIKNDPYHKALTNHQNAVTRGMTAGDTRNVNWYTMEGSVYP